MFDFRAILSRIMGIGAVQRQSIVSFIWQIATTFIGLLSTMYFAHIVGASDMGSYFLFMTYYGIINLVTDGGLSGAAIKRISEGEEQNAYFSAFFLINSFFVIAVIFALIVFRGYFVDLNNAGIFIYFISALIVSLIYGAVSSGVIGCGKMGIHTTCFFINNISRVIFQIVLVFLGFGVAGLAGGFVVGMLIAALIEFHFFDLHFMRFGLKHIKYLSTFSFWLFLTSGGMMVYSYTDTLIIGYYLSSADIGVYRIALLFSSASVIATTALRTALWPHVSRWGKIGEIKHIEYSLSRALSYSLLISTPILAGGILLGERLLYFFYGAEFTRGYSTLIILLIVQMINVFQFFFTTYLSAIDRQKDSFKVMLVAAAINVVLNLLLIPIIGIIGAAVASLIAMMLNTILAYNILSRSITIRVEYRSLLNILGASFAMTLIIGIYRLFVPLSNVWLTLLPVVFGGIFYLVLILKFDRRIYDELKEIAIGVKVPWPTWL